jgi:hypothetical protein
MRPSWQAAACCGCSHSHLQLLHQLQRMQVKLQLQPSAAGLARVAGPHSQAASLQVKQCSAQGDDRAVCCAVAVSENGVVRVGSVT